MYDIGFQRHRNYKFRVCGKDSIPLQLPSAINFNGIHSDSSFKYYFPASESLVYYPASWIYLHNKALWSYIYMSAIAGQTTGLNELTFFEGTHGCQGSNKG